jgi:ribonuclease P protein component
VSGQRRGEFRFPKRYRLRKRSEFLTVQKASKRKVHAKHFLVLAAPRQPSGATPQEQTSRVGITVSKKVGIAVTRNRIKRLVREFVRQHRHSWLPTGQDVVIIAKQSASSLGGLAEVEADLAPLGRRLRR